MLSRLRYLYFARFVEAIRALSGSGAIMHEVLRIDSVSDNGTVLHSTSKSGLAGGEPFIGNSGVIGVHPAWSEAILEATNPNDRSENRDRRVAHARAGRVFPKRCGTGHCCTSRGTVGRALLPAKPQAIYALSHQAPHRKIWRSASADAPLH